MKTQVNIRNTDGKSEDVDKPDERKVEAKIASISQGQEGTSYLKKHFL